MILNLNGKVVNEDIQLELPPLYFEKNQYVQVNHLFIKWRKKVGNIHGKITSSMVDKNPLNKYQQILFFTQMDKSNFLFFTPTHFSKYKIQCPCLQSSVFNLQLSEKHEILEIQIQLEITHERI